MTKFITLQFPRVGNQKGLSWEGWAQGLSPLVPTGESAPKLPFVVAGRPGPHWLWPEGLPVLDTGPLLPPAAHSQLASPTGRQRERPRPKPKSVYKLTKTNPGTKGGPRSRELGGQLGGGYTGFLIRSLGCGVGWGRRQPSWPGSSTAGELGRDPTLRAGGKTHGPCPQEMANLGPVSFRSSLQTVGGNGRGDFACVTPPGISCFVTETLSLGIRLAFPPAAETSGCHRSIGVSLVMANIFQAY